MLTVILLLSILVLLIVLLIVTLRRSRVRAEDIEAVLSRIWQASGVAEKIGEVVTHAREIKGIHRSIEQMLRVPVARGAFGEIALETILSDQLPPDMFGVREKVLDGKIPDAHIRSTVGIICIDSKFPLENYRKMVEAGDSAEKETFKKNFLRDVNGHLKKILSDYICPDKGSADFAFAYIPSEGVYWFLVNEAYPLLREYAKKGVQVVSPLTLAHKVELIKAGVQAKRLSQKAEEVKQDIIRLSRAFSAVDGMWRVLYGTHMRNLQAKAEELNSAYQRLREEFDRISNLE